MLQNVIKPANYTLEWKAWDENSSSRLIALFALIAEFITI